MTDSTTINALLIIAASVLLYCFIAGIAFHLLSRHSPDERAPSTTIVASVWWPLTLIAIIGYEVTLAGGKSAAYLTRRKSDVEALPVSHVEKDKKRRELDDV